MSDFNAEWPDHWDNNFSVDVYESTTLEHNDFSFLRDLDFTQSYETAAPTYETTSSNTSSSYPSPSISPVEGTQTPQSRKRRLGSEESQSDALVKVRKPRKLSDPDGTAKIRKKGACISCKIMRKKCDEGGPDGSCKPCRERVDKVIVIPGLLRPLCWRPNIGYIEVFRRGPTIDFAATQRGNVKDASPGKQALWKHFSTSKAGKEPSRFVELSQNWTSNRLKIQLDRYLPKETDRQHYSWFEDDVEQRYQTPPYGIANLSVATSAAKRFLAQNFEGYIQAHMRGASEITRKTFETAQQHKYLPLVESALKLWVACRFIEEPWSIVGSETLGMTRHPNPNCPYHERIPVPPIVDQQIDLIVINAILQPELKNILNMLKTMLESTHPWDNWFEIQLGYFILLHNVELTMAHDAWFVKRNNLKRKYSNKALVDTVMQGATTLLTCFHYAHQGYAPFSDPSWEHTQQWTPKQKEYLDAVRPMVQRMRGDHVHDPAKELFWTSQLHRPDWRPVLLVS